MHQIPRQYLRQFAPPNDPDKIWWFDLQERESKLLPIESVAQEKHFYTLDYERWLNEHIEGPAWALLDQLRRGQQVSIDDRRKVAGFVYSMIYRGSRYSESSNLKRIIRELGPESTANLRKDIEMDPEISEERRRRLLDEFDGPGTLTYYREPSEELARIVRSQSISAPVVALLLDMNWRVVTIKPGSPDRFITSNNPVFFHRGYGLKHQHGEMSFPLSSHVALHAGWQGRTRELIFVEGRPSIVREVNRRTFSESDRFLFCDSKAEWIWKMSPNRLRLNRIVW